MDSLKNDFKFSSQSSQSSQSSNSNSPYPNMNAVSQFSSNPTLVTDAKNNKGEPVPLLNSFSSFG
jgi:hypothetical protein